MKKFGFTLAEVLITLAVIGVVAAITLPSLNDDIGFKAIEKQNAKFYNTLTNAISMIQAEEQVDDISSINLTPEMILSKMKVKRTCAVKDCAPAQYGFADNSDKKTAAEIFSGIKGKEEYNTNFENDTNATNSESMSELEDGTLVYITGIQKDSNLTDSPEISTQPLTIYFDVNGKKGPNIYGRDLWAVSIDENGKINDTKLENVTHELDENGKSVTKKTETNLYEKLFKTASSFNEFRNNGFKFNCK